MKTLFGCITPENKVSFTEGGRLFCNNCYWQNGFEVRHYYKNGIHKIWMKCKGCHSTEMKNNSTGEILWQKQAMMFIDKYKPDFTPTY